jgi:hypothetical protein
VSFIWQLPHFNFEMMSNAEIKAWLHNDEDYMLGAKLYEKYGDDAFLSSMFAIGETRYNRERLTESLKLIASSVKKGTKNKVNPEPETESEPIYTTLKFPLHQYPKPIRQQIDQADKLHKQAKRMFRELQLNKRIIAGYEEDKWPYLSTDERKQNALRILDLFEENRRCWNEVNFYEEHGKILSPGKAPKFNLPEGEAALQVEIFRLRPLVSKWKKRLKDTKDEIRKTECAEKLKLYQDNLTEAERRLNEPV